MHPSMYRFVSLSAVVVIAVAAVTYTSALEIDDEAIDKAVGKAQELLKSQNMTVKLTDEQAMQVKEKLGRMAKQFAGPGGLLAGGLGGGLGGLGGLGGSRLLELLIFFLLRNSGRFQQGGGGFGGGGFGGGNSGNDGSQVILVPSQQQQTAAPAPTTGTSPFDLISLITLLGLLLLLISLLPTGF